MNGGNSSLNMKFPVFDEKNWNQWMIHMHVLFIAQDVFDLVNDSYAVVATEAQRNTYRELRKKDQKVLFYIHQCMDVNMFKKIADSTTAKDAWDIMVRW